MTRPLPTPLSPECHPLQRPSSVIPVQFSGSWKFVIRPGLRTDGQHLMVPTERHASCGGREREREYEDANDRSDKIHAFST
jgi:hypothetical protein